MSIFRYPVTAYARDLSTKQSFPQDVSKPLKLSPIPALLFGEQMMTSAHTNSRGHSSPLKGALQVLSA